MTFHFPLFQCMHAFGWGGTTRPDAIVGHGPDEQKVADLNEMIKVASLFWNRECGVKRPITQTSFLLHILLPLSKFMDLWVNEDLRDSLLFLLSFVCGFRGAMY